MTTTEQSADVDPNELQLRLSEVYILVIGDRVWGKAKTLNEALAKAGKPRRYIAYVVAPNTTVCEDGCLSFTPGYRPVLFYDNSGRKPRKGKR